MNILFLTDQDCNPQTGGISRVVDILSKSLTQNYQIQCHLAFCEPNNCEIESAFISRNRIYAESASEKLLEIIQQNEIEIVFSHLMNKRNRKFILPALLTGKTESNIQHIALFHGTPGYEIAHSKIDFILYRILHGGPIVPNVKLIGSQLAIRIMGNSLAKKTLYTKYKALYDSADKVVVLSPGYIPKYLDIIQKGANTDDKFESISNASSFPTFQVSGILDQKEKMVLIVARLSEYEKRLSTAFHIWQSVELSNEFPDWKLVVVGDGEDKHFYQHLIHKLKLKRVELTGRKNSLPYYMRASIFMMTSAFEGFPMTLLEATQSGCVPIVFDNFESAKSVVQHDENGILIPKGDTALYVKQLLRLMGDADTRNRMAKFGIEFSEQFSIANITELWVKLFSEI